MVAESHKILGIYKQICYVLKNFKAALSPYYGFLRRSLSLVSIAPTLLAVITKSCRKYADRPVLPFKSFLKFYLASASGDPPMSANSSTVRSVFFILLTDSHWLALNTLFKILPHVSTVGKAVPLG